MAHGTGLTRGDRRRNQEIAALREVVCRERHADVSASRRP
jgi:hypothetical protein